MIRYLITGGSGFIGCNIVRKLIKDDNNKVVVLDNFSTGNKQNLNDVLSNIELIEGDIRDKQKVDECVKNVDYILHQAAIPSVQRSIEDPYYSIDSNIMGTLNLLLSCKKYNIKKFILASSSSVYGNSHILPKTENLTSNPLSPYALSKYTGEKLCKMFSNIYNINTICLRYFNVFGPYQNEQSEYSAVIPLFINAFIQDKDIIIYGDGEQSRDFTFIDNVIKANILSCHCELGQGQIFNVGCGKQISLNQIIEKLKIIFNKDINVVYKDERIGDVKHSLANIEESKRWLQYYPSVEFDEGLQQTVEYFINKNK